MPPRSLRNDTADVSRRQPNKGGETVPFWETKTLETMTSLEWESLCDRCGRCCMVKLEDEDSGRIYRTDIACRLFDEDTCACRSYAARQKKVADCVRLTPEAVRSLNWLPETCAYRLVAEGRPLASWHPLLSGRAESVHEAGISVRGRIGGTERSVKVRDYVHHIIADDCDA